MDQMPMSDWCVLAVLLDHIFYLNPKNRASTLQGHWAVLIAAHDTHRTAGRLTSEARSRWQLKRQRPCTQQAGVSPSIRAGPVLFATGAGSNGAGHDGPGRAGVVGNSHPPLSLPCGGEDEGACSSAPG